MFERSQLLIAVASFAVGLATAASPIRYFKEDGGTGAMYISLAADGSYTVTAREHMGVWVGEHGSWSESGSRITFTPKKVGAAQYVAEEVSYKKRTFLSWKGNSGPSIQIPIEEIKRDLDKEPKALPPYVFFEISATVYQQETQLPYPFKTISRPH